MALRISALLLTLALGLTSAFAENSPEQNVQSLYYECKAPIGSPEYGICLGYIAGASDLLRFLYVYKQLHPEDANNPFQLCETPSYGALVQAFTKWAENNPREWSKNRLTGVMLSITANWPCR